MNIELLQGELAVSDTPGLSPIDPRFSDIATLVQEAQYEQAAAQAEAILQEEVYDVRIIGYFLYGHFIENGLAAMGDIFQCLADLLGEKLDALGPVKKREKHIQTILNWLMKQLLKKMQYEEEKKSGIWEAWLSDVTSEDVEEALESADALRRALGQVLEDLADPVLDGLRNVSEWLSAFQRLVYREPEPEPEEELEPEETPEAGETVDEADGAPRQTMARPLLLTGEGAAAGEGSYHLGLLIQKLEAFDRLIAERKFSLAALVADDLNNLVAHFDPKRYFPQLFSSFSLHFARNVNALTAVAPYRNTAAWQALKELYKVDLEGFVNFDEADIDLEASGPNSSYGQQPEYGAEPEEDSSDEETDYEEDTSTDEDDSW